VLELHALRGNGDFEAYRAWPEQQEFIGNHQARYRNTRSLAAAAALTSAATTAQAATTNTSSVR
jgi:hypothetical protein